MIRARLNLEKVVNKKENERKYLKMRSKYVENQQKLQVAKVAKD